MNIVMQVVSRTFTEAISSPLPGPIFNAKMKDNISITQTGDKEQVVRDMYKNTIA